MFFISETQFTMLEIGPRFRTKIALIKWSNYSNAID